MNLRHPQDARPIATRTIAAPVPLAKLGPSIEPAVGKAARPGTAGSLSHGERAGVRGYALPVGHYPLTRALRVRPLPMGEGGHCRVIWSEWLAPALLLHHGGGNVWPAPPAKAG
jgi:hypothetical protein